MKYYAARADVTVKAYQWVETTRFRTTRLSGTSNSDLSEALYDLASHIYTAHSVLEGDKHSVLTDLWHLYESLIQCYRSDSWCLLSKQRDTASAGA